MRGTSSVRRKSFGGHSTTIEDVFREPPGLPSAAAPRHWTKSGTRTKASFLRPCGAARAGASKRGVCQQGDWEPPSDATNGRVSGSSSQLASKPATIPDPGDTELAQRAAAHQKRMQDTLQRLQGSQSSKLDTTGYTLFKALHHKSLPPSHLQPAATNQSDTKVTLSRRSSQPTGLKFPESKGGEACRRGAERKDKNRGTNQEALKWEVKLLEARCAAAAKVRYASDRRRSGVFEDAEAVGNTSARAQTAVSRQGASSRETGSGQRAAALAHSSEPSGNARGCSDGPSDARGSSSGRSNGGTRTNAWGIQTDANREATRGKTAGNHKFSRGSHSLESHSWQPPARLGSNKDTTKVETFEFGRCSVQIEHDVSANGYRMPHMGLHLWPVARTVCQFMADRRSLLSQYTAVCELGAGVGLCGLFNSQLYCSSAAKRTVVLTDSAPAVLQLLARNMNRNRAPNTELHSCKLRWGEVGQIDVERLPIKQFDCILADMDRGVALFGLRVRSKALFEEVLLQARKCSMRLMDPLPADAELCHDQEVVLLFERTGTNRMNRNKDS